VRYKSDIITCPPYRQTNKKSKAVDRFMEYSRHGWALYRGSLFHNDIVKSYAEETEMEESFAEVVDSSASPGGLLFSISNFR